MKDRNLFLRTLTCVIGIPVVLGMIFLVPNYNYIAFSLFVIVLGAIGCREMSKMLFGKPVYTSYIAPLLPLVQYLQGIMHFNSQIPDLVFIMMLLWAFSTEILAGAQDDFKNSLDRAARTALLVLYPGYFLSFLLKLLALPNFTPQALMTFLILMFGNDISAYIWGRLFGKNNKGFIKASPKKSIAGYVGSFFSTIGLSFLCFAVFKNNLPYFSLFYRVILGIGMSISANIGDLIESVFKRSANVKDSGNVIPGRGGALDCLDSGITSAPIFFVIFTMVLESL